jgi:hypothetical protein
LNKCRGYLRKQEKIMNNEAASDRRSKGWFVTIACVKTITNRLPWAYQWPKINMVHCEIPKLLFLRCRDA